MRLLLAIAVFLLPLISYADSWEFEASVEEQEFVFGSTRVVRVVDSRLNQQHPDFRVDVYTNGELVGRFGGVHFEHIAASEDNQLFVGVSNRGLPGTAIIVFQASGALRALVNHNTRVERLFYCEQSVTLQRVWFDPENPALRIHSGNYGYELEVRGCKGGPLNILDLLQ